MLTQKPMAVSPATPAAAIAPAAHPMTFSVIIAVYNDWLPLDSCLRSLSEQAPGPSFEVIVVDDGSDKESPESILKWKQFYPLSIVRKLHSGIPSARNAGIRASRGSVLLFVDADSRLERNCLSTLHAIVEGHPEHGSFQLELIADCSTFSGRVEELRLMTLRQHMLQTSGCIRYLNTAGFAIRAARSNSEEGSIQHRGSKRRRHVVARESDAARPTSLSRCRGIGAACRASNVPAIAPEVHACGLSGGANLRVHCLPGNPDSRK